MSSLTMRSFVILALCAACGEADSDHDSDLFPVGTAPIADSGAIPPTGTGNVLPLPDAAAPVAVVPVIPTNDAGTGTGVNPIPVNPLPTRDAGAPIDSGTPPTSTPDTVCSGSSTGTAGSTADLTLNGRNYTLHIGKTVKPNQASPLVFSLHGLTMTPASMEAMARWDPIADAEGIIIARPLGVGASNAWDISGPTDFDLMKAIIEDVNKKACVDRKRIFATGFSMGGLMSFAMACKQGDIIAATAPNSGSGSAARGCVARAVPLFAFHGDADSVVAYSGGKSGVDSWVAHDKCTGSPTTFMVGTANCQDWNMCASGSEVKFCTVPGGGHTYTRAATQAIWDFFKVHPLP